MSDMQTPQEIPEPSDDDAIVEALNTPEPEENEDGLDDLEIGPEKYRVAKPIKEAWNGLQKSTQAEKEALKAKAEELSRREAAAVEGERARAALMDDIAELKTIDKALDTYKEMTPAKWVELSQNNPDSYNQHWPYYQALLAQRPQMYEKAQAKYAELQTKASQSQAERLAQAEKTLAEKIPDWSPQKRDTLIKEITDRGFSVDEVLPFATDHRFVSLVDDGLKYRAALAKAQAAKAAAKAAAQENAPTPEPVAFRPRGNSTTSSAPRDSDPPDVWLKKREAQLARQRR